MQPSTTFHRQPKLVPRDSLPDPATVRPYGLYGGGLLTGHPIGLLIAGALMLIALVKLPEARLFFAGSLILGTLIGFVLWLRHR
jgi:predicted lipid-binding transport protein (Tim44 family)